MSSNEAGRQPSAVERMKGTVKQPASAFTEGDSMHKQVWSAELSKAELEEVLKVAHIKLEAAVRRQIRALVKEAEKLKQKADQGLRVAEHQDFEDLKGDICAKVIERWMFEKRMDEMTGKPTWAKGDRVNGDVKLPMRIGLVQSNLDKGDDYLMEVSHPESAKYGKHYSVEEVTEIFAPAEDTVQSVRGWLQSAGIDAERISQSVNKQWLQFDAKTSEVEELLKSQYHFYEHGSLGSASIACDEYHVPAHIQKHVDYITPGIKLYATHTTKATPGEIEKRSSGFRKGRGRHPPPKKPMPTGIAAVADLGLAICDVAITPQCIMALYNITKGTLSAGTNQLGIFEDIGDVYSQTDLNDFFLTLTPYIPQGTHPKLDAIDGAIAPTSVASAGPESDLDFQISYPIIWPQNSVLYQTDDPVYEANYTYEGFLNNFLDAIDGSYCTYSAFNETGNSPLDPVYPDPAPGGYKGALQCGVYTATNVISISYGGEEADLPMSYQRRQCNEFMKLGMQGISICVSSGDSGVAGPAGDDNADGCLGPDGTIFSPQFPATCPYLTTLGATLLPPGGDVTKDQEVAVTRFPSGGGFSNIYPIPSYQASAVAGYFANHNPSYPYYSCTYNSSSCYTDGGIYNRDGRGYPDFSAVGDNVVIFNAGAPTLIGGTSASSPVFASILTRINEERIAAGKSTVGFVNPTLYANPGVLHDITVGNNSGCGTPGFYAATGWDP
ncbi:Tripeptidyl-peptidase sed1 [Oleoguttula mirabilis]|uniref:Tripeptidyl-peptidase sed1 n=1 Tax=Oleoguttula mirabilis TaxID=1507867 RepID=A0AAV9JYK5_9PEZI|nr:Tripeptidyl-peptidase sed1 [Oleoguttula mirabilis]